MAKTKKKKNYRLRKSVRRTLGALFMISAIVVAAIPFPDAAATNGISPQADDENTTISTDYNVTDNDLNAIEQTVKLKPDSDDETSMAYALVKDGSSYDYEWQFKYFLVDGDNAIITEYNDGYLDDEVTLEKVNANTYVEIIDEGAGGFSEYFSKDTELYNLTYNEWLTSSDMQTETSLNKYYPELYRDHIKRFEQYKADVEAAEKKGETVTSDEPEALSALLKDMKSDKREIYFLEYGFTTISGINTSFDSEKFELVDVLKPIDKTDSGTSDSTERSKVYYIVKLKNPADDDGFSKFYSDAHGFLYSAPKSYDIIGIGQNKEGKGAFENKNTFITLTLPRNIKYIADRAFFNSKIKTVTINDVSIIGNQAFKDSDLASIEWGEWVGTEKIGAEAFYNTQITNLEIPRTVKEIGAGAFANNLVLTSLDIADDSDGVSIGKYAFHGCTKLNSIDFTDERVTAIGEGAFAMSYTPDGNFTSFKFPKNINSVASLGPKILAGRSTLKSVVMPAELGITKTETLPENIFYNCSSLEYVEFPSDNNYCGHIKFSPDTFKTVSNSKFYVTGPKLAGDGTVAGPRQSTWSCTMKNGAAVPYMYVEDGKEYYEVCQDDTLLLSIDDSGTLQKCNFVERDEDSGDIEITDTPTDSSARLTIPEVVGDIPVKAIAKGCFTKTFLESVEGPLVIKDGGALKTIDDNVFAGASFSHVYIGDSVEKIGASAFENCKYLKQVTIGKNIKEIGDSAFKGCKKLEQIQFVEPDSTSTLTKIGTSAFATSTNDNESLGQLTIIGTISSDYLPFTWAMDTNNYADEREGVRVCYKTPAPTANLVLSDNYAQFTGEEYDDSKIEKIPTNLSVILDNITLLPTLVDYQHYSDIDESIREAYENNDTTGYNLAEEQQILTAINIVVPDGVKSIDVKKFLNNDGAGGKVNNAKSIEKYLLSDPTSRYSDYKTHGLFAGNFNEYEDGSSKELEDKGNDRIKSVVLKSVEYLPDNVFDNCENLDTVEIGAALEELGSIPFSNCPALSDIGFENEDKYYCENGIIYENKSDGTKAIIECLTGRGQSVGSPNVNLSTDPDLASTTEIKEKAFSECPYITSFDLTGVSAIDTIPKSCFEECTRLVNVDLPETVEFIDDRAFATRGNYIEITIRGRDLGIGSSICGNSNELLSTSNPSGTQAIVYTYDNSGVGKTLAKQGITLKEPPLGESKEYEVKFFDYDFKTQLGKTQVVKHGEFAAAPKEPTRKGYKFVGWSTYEWENNEKNTTGVTKDLDVIAMYETDTSTNNGNNNNNSNNNNGNNSNNGNNNGNNNNNSNTNSDSPIKGDYVNGGIDTNNDGIPDVDEKGNKLYKLTVTNGEGGGYYKAGQTVTIKAGNAPKGAAFAYWSCSNNDLIFQDHTDWITTLTMVAEDVTVICNFTGQYTLEVEYGTGSGSYPAGAKVAISALEAPQGREFANWTTKTNGLNIEDSTKATTIITMPQSNALITATYKDTPKKGSVSSNSTTPSKNNTSVVITKPGISDKNSASAYVSGSSDNFVVKISESLDAADEVQRALQKKYPDMSRIKYFAMDITLYDAKGENKITNTNGLKVNITMPIPDALREYAGNNRVGAVKNGELETLNPKFTTINGVPSISFTATHFSPYTIYVDTGNLTAAGTLDSTPKTGDGIHPKWFLSLGLACISIILFTKRDKKYVVKA